MVLASTILQSRTLCIHGKKRNDNKQKNEYEQDIEILIHSGYHGSGSFLY